MQRCASGPSPWHAFRLALSTKVAFLLVSLCQSVASHRVATRVIPLRGGVKGARGGASGPPSRGSRNVPRACRAPPATFFRLYSGIDHFNENDGGPRRKKCFVNYIFISIDKSDEMYRM